MMKQITRRLLAIGVLLLSFNASAEIVVGGKNFTEQQLLTEITVQYLNKKGYSVDKRSGMGSMVLRKAQENGQIDLCWEYTGTALIVYNKVKDKLPATKVYWRVKELDAKKGLVWLNPSKANNTYALAMRRDDAKQRGIATLSDLAEQMRQDPSMTIASNVEFYARKDGLRPLQKTYNFKTTRDQIKRMDSGLTYNALKNKEVDVALIFATDGRIKAFDFTVLKDDKQFFTEYAITPVVREETLAQYPKLAEQMNALSAVIDDETMINLNQQVDVERRSISDVASQFLADHNL